MGDCSKHKKEVAGISDMKELAEMVGDLHYETLAEFLWQLNLKIHNDAIKDAHGKRFLLATALATASNKINEAAQNIESAWQISKPFMKD